VIFLNNCCIQLSTVIYSFHYCDNSSLFQIKLVIQVKAFWVMMPCSVAVDRIPTTTLHKLQDFNLNVHYHEKVKLINLWISEYISPPVWTIAAGI
jgi:hypothetical protein